MRRRALLLCGVIAVLGLAQSSSAAPLVPVQITGVSGNVNVYLDDVKIGGPTSLDVTGGWLLFDAGAPEVLGFEILFESVTPIQLNQMVDIVGLGAFNQINIDAASLMSVGTYPATHVPLPQHPLQYVFSGPAHVESTVTLVPPPGGNTTPFPFDLDLESGFVRFTGFEAGDLMQLGVLVPLATFETVGGGTLRIEGDLVISGPVVAPEPDAALLLIVGAAIACVGVRGALGRGRASKRETAPSRVVARRNLFSNALP